ncbi:MAG TPA: acetyl-CoA carboxylase carboxyltransferase subunit alpha [Thermomicrobiaceae bacterium]|nr:acetyl-CoA carboxylase carboxyltransferase subunit alpha [Thermomicrobiaceae bacterium]
MPEASTAWDRVLRARSASRPHTLDYIGELVEGFVELHGDRQFGDDHALVGGIGRFRGIPVMVVGHQKGGNTRENLERNFGMPRPEGYRKSLRLMRQAEKFGLPVIAFVDTPAADPGLGSEERGQAVAIAESLLAMASLRVPTVAVVIGEGGSGGALAISVTDRLLMLENAIYAVASPEACATILWHDVGRAPEAAAALRLTAADLLTFEIVDEVIPEPVPADQEPGPTMHRVGDAVERHLRELDAVLQDEGVAALLDRRYAKYRHIGRWHEASPVDRSTNGLDPLSPQ